MRSLIHTGLTLVLLSACNCDEQLGKLSPALHVEAPISIQGDEYILDFGTVTIGASSEREIVIANDGPIEGHLTGIALRAASEPAFSFVEPPNPPAGVVASGS